MTNLRKRLDNVISELTIIQNALSTSGRHPPCCLTVQKSGDISCGVIGPLPKKEFLRECRKCRVAIMNFLESVGIENK